jgi:hypothetical protein
MGLPRGVVPVLLGGTSLGVVLGLGSGGWAHAEALPSPAAPSVDASAPIEVVVSAERGPAEVSSTRLDATLASRAPGGAGDPVKALESLPGVARPPLSSNQLVVWGAAPESTLFFIDGVEVPRLFHGSNIRSVLSADLIESVTLAPGAQGPDYGRGIGGAVRLGTRPLREESAHVAVDLSTLDGSAFVSDELGRGARLAIAGRYGWLDRTLGVVGAHPLGDVFSVPRYQDYQAKLELDLPEAAALDVALLGSGDQLQRNEPDTDRAAPRSSTASDGFQRLYLRYRRVSADGSSVEIVPWLGRDASDYSAHFGANPVMLDERALRFGLRAEHRSELTPGLELRLGIDAAGTLAHLTRSGSLTVPAREGDITLFGRPPGDDTNSDAWDASILDLGPYAALGFTWDALMLTPSLRVDSYLIEASRQTPRVGQTPSIGRTALTTELEPRIEARVALGARVALLAAAGLYSQPPAPRDLSAVFGTPSLGPERARHASLGESVEITPTLSLNTTAFVESMSALTVRDPAPTPELAHVLLQTGTGHSYGLQIALRQNPWHGFLGWLGYTLSRSERRDTPGANSRPFDADEPLVLSLVASQKLGDWTFGARFRYASGAPRTPLVGTLYDERDDTYQPLFGAHSSIRLPAFWQLDLRVDRRFRLGWGKLLGYLELLDVTNHANAEDYVYSADYTERGLVTGLPLVGIVGVRLEL